MRGRFTLLEGDALEKLKTLKDGSVDCCVTSPPYFGLRNYAVDGQIGLESLDEYVSKLVRVFREVRRVLKPEGTLWLNLGDSYATTGKHGSTSPSSTGLKVVKHQQRAGTPQGLKVKDLIGVPWRVAFALQEDGWYLRADIIWHKKNGMPESVRDRPTKAHEYVFLLTKSPKYFYDIDAIREPYAKGTPLVIERAKSFKKAAKSGNHSQGAPLIRLNPKGRNKRSVWSLVNEPCKEAHFAIFPQKLVEPCVLAGCPEDGIVLDCFAGSGTTGIVSLRHQRRFIGIEINRDYITITRRRLRECGTKRKAA